jgi:hypothetical protein
MTTLTLGQLWELIESAERSEPEWDKMPAAGIVVWSGCVPAVVKKLDTVRPEKQAYLAHLIGSIHPVPKQDGDGWPCRLFHIRDELREYLSECHRRKVESDDTQSAQAADEEFKKEA